MNPFESLLARGYLLRLKAQACIELVQPALFASPCVTSSVQLPDRWPALSFGQLLSPAKRFLPVFCSVIRSKQSGGESMAWGPSIGKNIRRLAPPFSKKT